MNTERPTRAGQAVARVLAEKGWTKREFARVTGVDERTVTRWLTGRSNPTATRLVAALRAARVDVAAYGFGEELGPEVVAVSEGLAAVQAQLDNVENLLERLWARVDGYGDVGVLLKAIDAHCRDASRAG